MIKTSTLFKVIILVLLFNNYSIFCASNIDYNSCLIKAVSDSSIEQIQWLLRLNPNTDINCEQNGLTPLMIATLNNNPEIVDLLLQNGAQIDVVSKKYAKTVVQMACNNSAIKNILFKYGASLDVYNQDLTDGENKIQRDSKDKEEKEDSELSIQKKQTILNQYFLMAVQHDDIQLAQEVLEKGAVLTCSDNNSKTALMLAVSSNNFKMVSFLLNRFGLNQDDKLRYLNRKDKNGKTAYLLAFEFKHFQIANLLAKLVYDKSEKFKAVQVIENYNQKCYLQNILENSKSVLEFRKEVFELRSRVKAELDLQRSFKRKSIDELRELNCQEELNRVVISNTQIRSQSLSKIALALSLNLNDTKLFSEQTQLQLAFQNVVCDIEQCNVILKDMSDKIDAIGIRKKDVKSNLNLYKFKIEALNTRLDVIEKSLKVRSVSESILDPKKLNTQLEIDNYLIDSVCQCSLYNIIRAIKLGANINCDPLICRLMRLNIKFDGVTWAILEFLLKNGADINSYDAQGSTPLLLAIRKGNLNLAQFLIDRNADCNLPARNGINKNALMIAICNIQENLNFIKLLINRSDLNYQDLNGETALTYTARYAYKYRGTDLEQYYLKILKILLKNGADASIRNRYADTFVDCLKKPRWINRMAKCHNLYKNNVTDVMHSISDIDNPYLQKLMVEYTGLKDENRIQPRTKQLNFDANEDQQEFGVANLFNGDDQYDS